MWIIQNSNNILFLLVFCKQQCFCQRLHAFRVNTNDSHQRDSIKKYIVSNCCFKKSHLVALLKETWFIFLNPFLWQITSGRICVHSGVLKLKRKLYVLRWWSTFCLNVLEFPCVCVRASDISAVCHFCYFGFKWKIKTPDKNVFVISFIVLLTWGTGGTLWLLWCVWYLVENNRHCSFPCGDMNLIPSFIIKLITRHLPNYTSLQLQ